MTIIHTVADTKAVKITLPALLLQLLLVLYLPAPWNVAPTLTSALCLIVLIFRGNFDLWMSYTPGDQLGIATLSLTFPNKRTTP